MRTTSLPRPSEVPTPECFANQWHLNSLQNPFGNVLVLCFTNDSDRLQLFEVTDPLTHIDIPHRSFFVQIEIVECVPPSHECDEISMLNFRRANFGALNRFFSSLDVEMIDIRDTNSATEWLYEQLYLAFECYVPRCRVSLGARHPWHNGELMRLRARKNKAYRQWKVGV